MPPSHAHERSQAQVGVVDDLRRELALGLRAHDHAAALGRDVAMVHHPRIERPLVHGEPEQPVAGEVQRDLVARRERDACRARR